MSPLSMPLVASRLCECIRRASRCVVGLVSEPVWCVARSVQSELRNLIVLKTTQTGFAGFLKNEHTTLPDVHDRLLSTNITATWRCVHGGPRLWQLSLLVRRSGG